MDIRDFPAEAIKAKTGDPAHTEELFNVAIQVAAQCQVKLNFSGLFLSKQQNGDIIVSIVADSSTGNAAYARVHRATGAIEFREFLYCHEQLLATDEFNFGH